MIPSTNPYYDQGRIKAQIWSLGHRNLLGIAFDKAGNLWTHEMGPRGGDEFNLVRKGENYGWPKVSEGRHYGGTPIPAHSTDPKFIPPKVSWTPVISPAGRSTVGMTVILGAGRKRYRIGHRRRAACGTASVTTSRTRSSKWRWKPTRPISAPANWRCASPTRSATSYRNPRFTACSRDRKSTRLNSSH